MDSFRIILLCFLLGCSFLACSQSQPPKDFQMIDELLQHKVKEEKVPGMVAAIADHSGIRTIGAAGVRKIKSDTLFTADDKVHIGSCTKAMTSVLIATLVMDEVLHWETTILDVYPELKDSIHADYHDVTIWDLVTHRSGIVANASKWRMKEDLEIKERRVELLKANLKKASKTGKGTFEYSNLGYMVAGSMCERLTGKSWEDLMQERLFGPLDMQSAGFGAPSRNGDMDQPWGHLKQIFGGLSPIQVDNAAALGPAGTIHCTLTDWAKFAALFLPASPQTILDQTQLKKLVEPVGEYAAGWGIVERSWAKGTALTHSGSNTTWLANIWVVPNLDRIYIVAINAYTNKTEAVADGTIVELLKMDGQLSK